MTASTKYPSRIVCLTEETTETLYLLGQGDRVVGVGRLHVGVHDVADQHRSSSGP